MTGRLRRAVILAALAAGLLSGAARAAPAGLDDAEVTRLLAEAKVPSVSVARIEGGEIVFARAWGDRSPGGAATTGTLYNVASLTKPVTAEVLLRLASENSLGLDEPMAPTWVDPDVAADPRAARLTPRIALSHRTGFPNWRAATGLAFGYEPGASHGYSGEGYVYAARFAEKRTGASLQSLSERLLFGPLGMGDTSYVRQPWFAGRIATPTSAAGETLTPATVDQANAADMIYTTAEDYARFMVSVMRAEGLTPALAAERLRVQTDMKSEWCPATKPACPDTLGFGLGWEVATFGDRVYLMHTGRDPGLFTLAYLRPDTQSGMVILTNSENGAAVMLPLMERLGAEAEFLAYLKSR